MALDEFLAKQSHRVAAELARLRWENAILTKTVNEIVWLLCTESAMTIGTPSLLN
jgi:hypothetical protein